LLGRKQGYEEVITLTISTPTINDEGGTEAQAHDHAYGPQPPWKAEAKSDDTNDRCDWNCDDGSEFHLAFHSANFQEQFLFFTHETVGRQR